MGHISMGVDISSDTGSGRDALVADGFGNG